MEHEKFYYPILVREHYLDTFSHMNHATYVQILEEARWELVTSRGFGLKTILKMGLGPTILEVNIKYLKEIRLRQQLVIESQLISYVKKISVMRQRILGEGNEVHCEALITVALFDVKERKLIEPTQEWLYAIGYRQELTGK